VVKEVAEDKIQIWLPDFANAEVPFVEGMDWAKPYISENHVGAAPASPADIVKPADIIWVERKDDQWWLASVPAVEGAIVSLDPSSGAILALVGGFDYFHSKFNRAVQAKRQPGSNFKPFIYSAALEKGLTAASIINDAPVVFDDDSLEATWRPENYSGRFYGPTRLREALVKSRNLVSIRILQSIGLRFATGYAEKFGLDRKAMPYDLSLALGSGAFSPLEIVRAYAVFANSGYLITPYYIKRIESSDGEVLFQSNPLTVCQGCKEEPDKEQPAEEGVKEEAVVADEQATSLDQAEAEPVIQYAPQVITPQNAYIVRSMLREVVRRGTAVRAKVLGRSDIAGKTGTSNDQKDAWFSGFNDQVVTTAWVGFDNQKPLGSRETGGRAALPMWVDYMRDALQGLPINLEEQPENIVTVRIDEDTGQRATENSRHTRFEIFKVGTAPEEIKQHVGGGRKHLVNENVPVPGEDIAEEIF
jgi:penicillin-binding protein 1A